VAAKNPFEAFKAQGIPTTPVGTLDELIAHKMPTSLFQSCAEPSPDGTIKGCDQWYECTMSYKGLPVAEGGGPRNHCWERVKSAGNGSGVVRNIQPCFWGVAQQENTMLNKESLEPIADEGQPWEELTTVPDKTSPRDGVLGYTKYDTKLIPHEAVTPFVRLGQEQKLAKHELLASIIERRRKGQREAHNAKVVGLPGNEAALDKRGRRGSEGTKKEG
jgi:hypothetical protein